MPIHVETEREADGRWLAEVPELPGVLAYGETPEEAERAALALAAEVLVARGETDPTRTVDTANPRENTSD